MKSLVLIIDDDPTICQSLRLVLRRAGINSEAVQRPREALSTIAQRQPQLVLLDMNFTVDTSGRQGLQLLRDIKAQHSQLPVILLTGWATVQLAVEGMKIGARDFLAKPWDNQQLLSSIRNLLAEQPVRTSTSEDSFGHIIGQDPQLAELIATARQIAPTQASVLITGESGTGKELLAEAIHLESRRANQAFVKVNLGGIPESLFESELFGHVKGAFTDAKADRSGRFTLADGGTIFLDEIGDLPLPNQVKLLRVLQEKTIEKLGSSRTQRIDVRVISATNKTLDTMVQQGTFREDLLYRINLIQLHLPPLRQRPGDIPLLVDHFLEQLAHNYQREPLQLTTDARQWLREQLFPGNIRQLKNLVERSLLLAKGPQLSATDFAQHLQPTQRNDQHFATDLTLEELEVQAIKRALAVHQHNITAAARALGVTRSALYRRLEKFGIEHAT